MVTICDGGHAMNRRSTLSALVVLPVLCLVLAGFAPSDPKDEAAIRELVTALETAHNKHDARAFAAIFAADGEFTSVKGSTAVGPQAIEEYHRPLFEGDPSNGRPSFKNAVVKNDGVKVRFIRPD